MKCHDCNVDGDEGDRYCSQCGAYLAVQPGPAPLELLQLSPTDFLTAVASGVPLIWKNASRLWSEANELSLAGSRRGVCILQGLAEEEAAKALILLDAVRCPEAFKFEFSRLLKQIDQHVGKGVYVSYYDTSPSDMTDVKRIVDRERQGFYREGEYGEFILPNRIKTSRESRLYVSYVRNDDGTSEWIAPRDPLDFEVRSRSGTIRVVEALFAAGIFEVESMKVFRDYWRKIPFADIGTDPLAVDLDRSIRWRELTDLNFGMLKELDHLSLLSSAATVEHQQTLIRELLFPLYPFDLRITKNFSGLPPPDSPYY
jgi:AbiV family abortive infection protein